MSTQNLRLLLDQFANTATQASEVSREIAEWIDKGLLLRRAHENCIAKMEDLTQNLERLYQAMETAKAAERSEET
jgi:hypothetical protein